MESIIIIITAQVMGDLASNFPSHARSLSRITVPKELKKEVKKNSDIFYSSLNVQPNDAALFINGQHFDMEFTDIFTILDRSVARSCSHTLTLSHTHTLMLCYHTLTLTLTLLHSHTHTITLSL